MARQGNGGHGSPRIETDEQAAGWCRVVEAVHAKGATILLQLWHVGRVSHASLQPDGGEPIVPSAIDAGLGVLLKDRYGPATPPREITLAEIPAIVAQYRAANERANEAGLDGIEIHGTNRYLID